MRIIVCGGRDFADAESVYATLSRLSRIATIITGGATGADALADEAARQMGFAGVESYPADWKRYGRRAGPLRNQQMLDAGADLVIAFLGGRGTADMVRRARHAGTPVIEIPARW